MNREWFTRLLQVTVVALTVAAVCQEREERGQEREWQGTAARRAGTLEAMGAPSFEGPQELIKKCRASAS